MSPIPDLAPLLLEWWDEGHAQLPWRQDKPKAYPVWVAEVMLQQTQVKTAIPYFQRWMARFPTIEALASASIDEVLKVWQGLGYYSRARNLHDSAVEVDRKFDGRLPDTVGELTSLKGIGPYTAGAIASIVYNRSVPVVDGNVTRVLTRLLDIPGDISTAPVKKKLWQIAGDLVPDERPGDYNQALMELGQVVCLAAAPRCHVCPLSQPCLARQRGTQLERPVRPPRPRTPHYDVTAGVIWDRDGRLLIARRPLNGLLGGLWEFPGGKVERDESLAQALIREVREELGIVIEVGRPLAKIGHAYTHFRITLHPFHARHISGRPQNMGVDNHAWVRPEQLDGYAFPATDRQIIEQLRDDPEPFRPSGL